MDDIFLATIRKLEARVEAMNRLLVTLGYRGPLPDGEVEVNNSEKITEFLQKIADSRSKFSREAKELLANNP